jgi:ribosomal protein S18 acetylase RimI-like enzyme
VKPQHDPAPIRVRPAHLDDAETIARFQETMALVTEHKVLDPGKIRRGVAAVFADAERGFYLVAEAGEQVIASLLVTREWSDWRDGWFWWIQSVFVAEDWRRRGVYRLLHEAVRDRAKQAGGIVGVRLYVEKDNTAAQQVYRALGMRETDYRLYEE